MPKTLEDIFPASDELLTLEPEEIGMFILEHFCQAEDLGVRQQLNGNNFINDVHSSSLREAERVIIEGYNWLLRQGLIAEEPASSGNWIFVTRRGRRLNDSSNLRSYLYPPLIKEERLDPVLARKIVPEFRRGDYDTAIFQAYKELEIRVREASDYGSDMIGKKLMGAAFHKESGPLNDKDQEENEKVAVRNIFCGVIGLFKNPFSHRDVNVDDPYEAAELIFFANYLLRFVERRKEMLEERDEEPE